MSYLTARLLVVVVRCVMMIQVDRKNGDDMNTEHRTNYFVFSDLCETVRMGLRAILAQRIHSWH